MIGPATPKQTSTASFNEVLDAAVKTGIDYKKTRDHALKIGVDPQEIIEYAKGNRPAGAEAMFARSPWAMSRVVALVKAARRPGSLGYNLLSSPDDSISAGSGIKRGEGHLAALLDQVE